MECEGSFSAKLCRFVLTGLAYSFFLFFSPEGSEPTQMRVSLHYCFVAFYLTILLTRNGRWSASLPPRRGDAHHQRVEEARCVQAAAPAPCCWWESCPRGGGGMSATSAGIGEMGTVHSHCAFCHDQSCFPPMSMPTPPVMISHPPTCWWYSTLSVWIRQQLGSNIFHLAAAVLSFP